MNEEEKTIEEKQESKEIQPEEAIRVLNERAEKQRKIAWAEIEAVLEKHGMQFDIATTLYRNSIMHRIELVPKAQQG